MFIYQIENIKNGKIYIGQTTESNPENRWKDHQYELNHNIHHNIYLQRSWNKYGQQSFSFSVLCEASNQEELDKLEDEYIRSTKKKYNIREGGSRGSHTRESKKKISENLYMYFQTHPEAREHLSKMRKGKKLSEKTKENMKLGHDGNRGSNHHNSSLTESKVKQIRKEYIPYEVGFGTLAKKYGVDRKTIVRIIQNKTWTHI